MSWCHLFAIKLQDVFFEVCPLTCCLLCMLSSCMMTPLHAVFLNTALFACSLRMLSSCMMSILPSWHSAIFKYCLLWMLPSLQSAHWHAAFFACSPLCMLSSCILTFCILPSLNAALLPTLNVAFFTVCPLTRRLLWMLSCMLPSLYSSLATCFAFYPLACCPLCILPSFIIPSCMLTSEMLFCCMLPSYFLPWSYSNKSFISALQASLLQWHLATVVTHFRRPWGPNWHGRTGQLLRTQEKGPGVWAWMRYWRA